MPPPHAKTWFGRSHPAFTIVEMVAALSILGMVAVLIAQVGAWSLQEIARNAARQVALEWATNQLEAARALPWSDLTEAWVQKQKLPDDLLPQGKLSLKVQTEKERPYLKRVTVLVSWQLEETLPPHQVSLVGLFSARKSPKSAGEP